MLFNLLERHRDKWVEDGDCYRWTGALANGRPQVGIAGEYRSAYVARIMCEEAHGPPPSPKHDAAHDTPNGCIGALCVNGEHLRWATRRENMLDIPIEDRKVTMRNARGSKPLEARALAKLAGEKTYFSGKTCPRGHNGLRITSTGMCVECHRITANQKRDSKR